MGVVQVAALFYLSREFREQLRRNLVLGTQFQKWSAEPFGDVGPRLDRILQMLRTRQL